MSEISRRFSSEKIKELGLPDARELLDCYTKVRGIRIEQDFKSSAYTVYMFYKTCCILQGVYKRFTIGKLVAIIIPKAKYVMIDTKDSRDNMLYPPIFAMQYNTKTTDLISMKFDTRVKYIGS